MSFATNIGHTFTGVLGHHGHVHVARRRSATPAVNPAPAPGTRHVRSMVPVDAAVTDHRHELEQWSAAFMLAVALNR